MMNYKKGFLLLALFTCFLTACEKEEEAESVASTTIGNTHVIYDQDDEYVDFEEATTINLDEESGTVLIQEAGTYELRGTLTNGNIEVVVGKEDVVRLVLNNASISSSDGSAILCEQAKKLIISLPSGTTNKVEDSSSYINVDTSTPSAAIFVQDDVTFNGTGTLQVNGNYNDAISCKDTLKIMEGVYQIRAVDDGIVGRDFLYIKDGTYFIEVEGDGLKTTYDTNTDKGDMVLEQGTFTIVSGNDAIQAEHNLTIYDGTYTITSGGGSVNGAIASNTNQPGGFGKWNVDTTKSDTEVSAKGLKAGAHLYLVEGVFTLDTSDDAIHANENVTIDNGNYTILSGDDGIHADATLKIHNGRIDIQKSYEGLEGQNVNLYNGSIDVVSSDDGVNAAGGNDGEDAMHPGQDTFAEGSASISIFGGNLIVHADGDGLDSNGNILMEGGTVVVFGSENSGNGALDYDGECKVIGGTLIAVGTSGMAQHVSSSSTQYSVLINLSEMQEANSTLYLSDENDEFVIGVTPTKNYNSIVISSPLLKENMTYYVNTYGSGGNINDAGYIEYGVNNGTQVDSFTLSSILTTVGTSSMDKGTPTGRKPF